MKEKETFQPMHLNNVLEIYEFLLKHDHVAFPITEQAIRKLDSLLASVSGTYFGKPSYDTPQEKVVAYLYFIVKNHPFTDGNKRTASIVFTTACTTNGLQPQYQGFDLESLAIFVERSQGSNHQGFIKDLASVLF